MKKLFWIFASIISLFVSCKSQQLTGRYIYKQDFTFHRLDLKDDSTFVYHINTDLILDSTVGRWNYRNLFLYLRSDKADMPCQVNEEVNTQIDGLAISLSDKYGGVTKGDYVSVNGDFNVRYYVNDLGEISVDSLQNSINEIFIYSIWLQCNYQIVNKNSNIFIITYDFANSTSFYFDNQIFIVRNNKIKIQDGPFFLRKRK